MKATRLLKILAITFITSGPVGGFIFGFIECDDCGWNVLGRAFIGCVMAVLTPLSFGFPLQNEGGVGAPFNAWPQIIISALLIFAGLIYREYRIRNETEPNK